MRSRVALTTSVLLCLVATAAAAGLPGTRLAVSTGAGDMAIALVTAASGAMAGNGREFPACATCHGVNGEGNPLMGYPRLAGLPAKYLQTQLNNFATGKRADGTMTPISQSLSVDERRAIAGVYATLGPSGHHESVASARKPAPVMPGETLAVRGRWRDNLPACAQCHGNGARGVGEAFPPLAGQSALYLENQLRAWQSGTREPGPLGLMGSIARKLNADDVKAVAAYLSSLPLRGEGYSP